MMATDTVKFTSNPKNLKDIRAYMRKISKQAGFSEKEIHDIVLAVDEACSNIIRHAYKQDYHQEILISTEQKKDKLKVVLQDFGCKPNMKKMENPPTEKLRCGGYGVIFINKLMDEVHYDLSPAAGTILTLIKTRKDL